MAPLRRAALCLTDQPLLAGGYRPSAHPLNVTFAPRGDAVPLRGTTGFRSVGLFVNQRYRLERATGTGSGRWIAVTVGYRYDILDPDGREILAYH